MGVPESKLYTFKNVSVSVDGNEYAVASVMLILQENAIPMLRLILDPSHKYGSPSDQAQVADLKSASEWLTPLLLAAEKKTTATEFNLDMMAEGKSGDVSAEQQISLSGWVLNSAGLVGVSASGGFTLGLELLHPIAKLQYAGLNMGSIFGSSNVNEPITASDIVGGLAQALIKYNEIILESNFIAATQCDASCSSSGADASKFVTAFKAALVKTSTDLTDNLKWDTSLTTGTYNNWPLTCLSKELAIKRALLPYILSGLKDVNAWELLVRDICPEWYVSIIPTYWNDEKLTMIPFTPWDVAKIKFNSNVVSDITFPSSDPNPLTGTWISYSKPGMQPDYTWYLSPKSDEAAVFSGMGYISPGNPPGQIALGGAPSWYSSAILSDGSSPDYDPVSLEANSLLNTPANMSYSDLATTVADTSGSDPEHGKIRSGIAAIAEQTFLTLYRQESQIVLQCPLLITYENSQIPGKFVIPGVSADVLDEKGTTAVSFHIIGVTHQIDCMNSTAGTAINGVYARPGGSGYVSIPVPTFNPVYSH